jgi:hypothetical protein
LDALAKKISELYDIFDTRYNQPTMGDVFKAKDRKESVAWDYRRKGGKKITSSPLQALFTQEVWCDLADLNDFTNKKYMMVFCLVVGESRILFLLILNLIVV